MCGSERSEHGLISSIAFSVSYSYNHLSGKGHLALSRRGEPGRALLEGGGADDRLAGRRVWISRGQTGPRLADQPQYEAIREGHGRLSSS